jgi:hypothetical protein
MIVSMGHLPAHIRIGVPQGGVIAATSCMAREAGAGADVCLKGLPSLECMTGRARSVGIVLLRPVC